MSTSPLIVVGTGRCGSTILHEVLTHHPRLAWPVRSLNANPRNLLENQQAMRWLDVPLVRELVWRKSHVGEVYGFWNHHFRGFGTPYRDLTSNDLDERSRKSLQAAFAKLTTPSRPRVLMKITGYPRIEFLRAAFPDAQFVHIVRDARPTALSDMAMPWCDLWRGPDRWLWGPLDEEKLSRWKASGESFHVLAVLLWQKLIEHYQASGKSLSDDQYLELRYEDLCADPKATMTRILEFANLDWHPRFKQKFSSYRLQTTNEKWKSQVTDEQRNAMTRAVKEMLEHYGYET